MQFLDQLDMRSNHLRITVLPLVGESNQLGTLHIYIYLYIFCVIFFLKINYNFISRHAIHYIERKTLVLSIVSNSHSTWRGKLNQFIITYIC